MIAFSRAEDTTGNCAKMAHALTWSVRGGHLENILRANHPAPPMEAAELADKLSACTTIDAAHMFVRDLEHIYSDFSIFS